MGAEWLLPRSGVLEEQVDRLDERLLERDVQERELLRQLVQLRRRITKLRATLVPHREVLAVLAQPNSDVFTSSDSSEEFQRVYERLEKAVESVENAREMAIGSFEVFMTQTAQQTNDVMKVLTLVSVLLLPSAVIAGIMGMNFQAGFFKIGALFWVAIASMVAVAGTILMAVRRRGWV